MNVGGKVQEWRIINDMYMIEITANRSRMKIETLGIQ